MTATLSEDDIYRTSTQYRLWSFSPEKLALLRRQTHETAWERTKQNHARGGAQVSKTINDNDELALVVRYCAQLRTTSDHFKFPPSVKATAVQYLKRFYLSNSILTYPPKEIYKTVLFLACKTEGTHLTLSEYARRISTEKEVILAPEYKIMQALRFTLDVKQPFRGLKGVFMELLNMVTVPDTAQASGSQHGLASVAAPSEASRTLWKQPINGPAGAKDLEDRVQAAYATARTLLDAPSLLTDVYFLYTPSQILLACLRLADAPLTDFYLSTKLPNDSPMRPKILATIQECAEVISAFSSDSIMSKDGRSALEEKLETCRDPSTRDLVKNHMAAKSGDSDEEDAKIKKRQTERDALMKEGDDLFGPSIPKANGSHA